MKKQIAIIIATIVFAIRANAGMVRVIAVENANTLTVEREGVRSSVTLAGIVITDPASAKSLLEWTVPTSWVMVEATSGGALVYRSPDGLFLNRELVVRGYARATMHGIEPESRVPVTYLGTLNPSSPPLRGAAPAARARTAPAPERGSGSATRRRSPASRSPRPRAAR